MTKITIEIFDTPEGHVGWTAYTDKPWTGGRAFTQAENIAHQVIMNLDASLPNASLPKPEPPKPKEAPKKEGNVIHVDFQKREVPNEVAE